MHWYVKVAFRCSREQVSVNALVFVAQQFSAHIGNGRSTNNM